MTTERTADRPAGHAAPTAMDTDRLLRWSVLGAGAFALVAIGWGMLAGSKMILFDGMYSSISVGLSALSLAAYRAVQRGPDADYPYGRDAMGSLVIVVKGIAIGALSIYALAGAILDLLAGGREVAVGAAALYAALATLGCAGVALLLRRGNRRAHSELLGAEVSQWLLDTALSAAVLVGFLGALLLEARDRGDLAAYVDPLMVAVLSALFLALPVRLIRTGLRGALAAAPDLEVQQQLAAVVDEVAARHGFAGSSCRVASFGERYDVTIVLLAGDATDVDGLEGFDGVRAELADRFDALPHDLLVTVSFTADERWTR